MQGVNCVKGEIHSVLTALRIHNPTKRYGSYGAEDASGSYENPLVRKLKDLYEQLSNIDDLTLIDSVQVFDPFLSVVVAANTNAIVTDAALQAIHKFMLYGHVHQHSFNAAQAMSNIGHSVAQCKFDAPSEDEAEVVYMKSLEVLVECLKCPAGSLLTDDAVCEMVTQCFSVRSRPNISKLLRRHADNALLQMVLVIFARLSPETTTGGEDTIVWDYRRREVEAKRTSKAAKTPSEGCIPYGVNTMQRVLKFIVKLMDLTRPGSNMDTLELGCRLVRTAFETAGSRVGRFPSLVQVIQEQLCKRLLQNSQTKNLHILSLTLRIVYDLFNAVKAHLKVQLEVFFTSIHMRIGESESSSYEEKELVLESLVEFCNDESLIVGLYRNYDCEVSSTNLYEDLCKFLAENSLPPSSGLRNRKAPGTKEGSLQRLHVLSLEGVLAMIHSLARRFGSNGSNNDDADQDNVEDADDLKGVTSEESKRIMRNRRHKQDLMRAAKHFNAKGYKALKYIEGLGLINDAEDPSEIVRFLKTSPGLDKKAVGEMLGGSKALQQKVMKSYIRSFKFPFPKTPPYVSLEEQNSPKQPRGTSSNGEDQNTCIEMQAGSETRGGLDHGGEGKEGQGSRTVPTTIQRDNNSSKNAAKVENGTGHDAGVGSVEARGSGGSHGGLNSFGENSSLRAVHLDESGVWVTGRIDRGLRAMLETFHLPKEAQQIARLLEEFSAAFYRHSPGPIRDEEACYVLTYAVMMLHTDAHNPRVAKKMGRDTFTSTLRGTNKGQDFPPKYLQDIYDEITTKEIKVLNSELRSASGQTRDVKEIDASWQQLIERSRQTGPFQVKMAQTHGREMFQIIWTQVEEIVMHYFDHPDLYADQVSLHTLDKRSRRNERRLLLNKIVHGMYAVANLCSVYNLNNALDKLLAGLASRLGKQLDSVYFNAGTIREGRARFGRNRRAQKLAHLLFDLLAKYGGSHGLNSWEQVVDCMLKFHRLGLLPESLLETDDFTDSSGKPLPSLRRKITLSETKSGSERGGGGVLGFIASSLSLMWAATESEEEDNGEGSAWSSSSEAETEPREEEKLAAIGKACVALYGIPALFKSTRYWASSSLTHLLSPLLKIASLPVSSLSQKTPRGAVLKAAADTSTSEAELERSKGAMEEKLVGEVSGTLDSNQHSVGNPVQANKYRNVEETAVFCLERVSDIICANGERAFDRKLQLWRPVLTLIEKALVVNPQAPSYFTERVVVNALRFSINMYSTSPGVSVRSNATSTCSSNSDSGTYRGGMSHSTTNAVSGTGHKAANHNAHNRSGKVSENRGVSHSVTAAPAPSTSTLALCDRKHTVEEEGQAEGLLEHIIQIYALLNAHLSPQALYAFGQRVVAGLRVFARSNVDEFTPPQWQVVFKVYTRLRYHPKAAKAAFEDLSALCKIMKDPVLFRPAVAALCSFFPPAHSGTTWSLVPPDQIFKVLLKLHNRIPNFCFSSQSLREQQDGSAVSLNRHSLWLYSINTIGSLTKHPRVSIKEMALEHLRTALLASDWDMNEEDTWKKCFIQSLFPILNDLVAITAHDPPANQQKESPDRAHIPEQKDLRLSAATLIFQTFLHHMTILGNMRTFNVFWFQFLGSIERYMKAPDSASSSTFSQLHVHVTEHFKNLLLVMAASGVFKRASKNAGQDLLALTWNVLESFRPDLRQQLQELAGDSRHAAHQTKPSTKP
eukprot:CAMPEP_0184485320 /NCGR_PEP_ID=MMETSP0113_2-20130426/6941_1 /TAXON_ID=91329 /ORGANISM="Norrisiella sphaerica, Strain BC52" /LENGTH=1700 /DNA_ID=CAMNT_0026866717 /DNA_START=115 /DNA_END=5217 /DNA_ORIENTATION=+